MILSVSCQVWNILRPCTVFRVRDLNITSSSGFSTWIGSWGRGGEEGEDREREREEEGGESREGEGGGGGGGG